MYLEILDKKQRSAMLSVLTCHLGFSQYSTGVMLILCSLLNKYVHSRCSDELSEFERSTILAARSRYFIVEIARRNRKFYANIFLSGFSMEKSLKPRRKIRANSKELY